MAIQSIGEGVWIAEGYLNDKGMKFPLRMTILRLDASNLMVISPILPTQEMIQDIEGIGLVKYIVAPNCMHHKFVNKFAAAFPGAEIWGPKDLHDKRPDISFTDVLDSHQVAPWSAFVDMVSIHAKPPMFEEVIFFHKASKTVVVTDMLFNFHKFDSWFQALIARINGGYKRLAMTRLGRVFFNDKESLHKAASRILTWNPENLVVAHGDIVVGHAHNVLQEPLAAFASTNS
ncbi:DUF4336 domain-containing protein [Bdellovibrio sp. HCB337]|uniref:DUF4336 domain-containing protein n=1 Tax=Bdellovibrio sp. HCB337 TaxID=3394358 RepID=UPI0039A6A3CB